MVVSERNTEFWHETLIWRSPIGLTQSDLMTSLSHGTAGWFSPVSVVGLGDNSIMIIIVI